MATNEILQFASTDTGTNLLTQAEYTADAQRTTGNQPGIARSKLVNKSLRQASLIAAGLAEFIADYQANNVTDSLTPQNIADYLLDAIKASFPSATETLQGKIELATNAEVQAGADSARAITPAGLSSRTATTTRTGILRVSEQSEAIAGSLDDSIITPLRLRQGMNATNGAMPMYACRAWVSFAAPNGVVSVNGSGNIAYVIQNSVGDYTVHYQTAMPDTNYAVMAVAKEANDTDGRFQFQSDSPKSIYWVRVICDDASTGGTSLVNASVFDLTVFR